MIVAPTVAPAPTPAPTLPSAYALADLRPRQTFFDYSIDYSVDLDCLNINAALQCTSILTGCYSDLVDATDINEAATACYCDYGMPYLNCFYTEVATGTCSSYFLGTEGFGEYQRSFFSDFCGTIPPSVMASIQVPTSVSLDFETVDVVTATGALQQPNYNGQPNYLGSGQLLQGPCSETDFTRVDASSTVYYAGFQGCVKDRPECCPWAVDMAATAAPPGAGGGAGDTYDFPQPVEQDMAVLASCADDYYSISGGCCPNGFWPFTSKVGGITPCWSSVDTIAPPTLTIQSDETAKDKPTSAVVNIVWSMRYPVADPGGGGGGLSTAAKAGIGAGAGVAAIIIAGLVICLWRQRRKNKKPAEDQPAVPPPQAQPQQQQQPPFQQQPQMMQQAVVPNGQYPPSAYSNMPPPPSDRASITTSGTPISPLALVPQNTGTSNGRISELSSAQSDQQLLHNNNNGQAANIHRGSYGSSSGSGAASPAVGPNGPGGYPAPIAEADEGRAMQYPPQYGYQQQQQQQQYPQQQQQQYPQQQQQQYYYVPPVQQPMQQQHMQMQMPAQGQQGQGQYYPPQGGYAYPQQQQQGYPPQNVPEMSAGREADPPQEVMGSQVAGRGG